MSLDRYQQSLALLNLQPNEIRWFPKWLGAYAGNRQVKRQIAPGGDIPVERELVIGFLRSLRDNRVPAWQRLQAARAIETYQTTVLRTSVVDFRPIRAKTSEYRPVVLTPSEIKAVFRFVTGIYLIMFLLMYGGGLRHRECRTLRVYAQT